MATEIVIDQLIERMKDSFSSFALSLAIDKVF
jgi:hypothetical protein